MSYQFINAEFLKADEKIKDDALEVFLDVRAKRGRMPILKFGELNRLFNSRFGIAKDEIFIQYRFEDSETKEELHFNASSAMDVLCRRHNAYPSMIADIIFE